MKIPYKISQEDLKKQMSFDTIPFEETPMNKKAPLIKTNDKILIRLSASQLAVVNFIHKQIQKSQTGLTDRLSIEQIVTEIKSGSNTVKSSVFRLKKLGHLIIYDSKRGNQGWCRYVLSEDLNAELADPSNSHFLPVTRGRKKVTKRKGRPKGSKNKK